MRTLCLSVVLGVVCVAVHAQERDISEVSKDDRREHFRTAIVLGIELLEKKEIKKFLVTFVSPDDMKKIEKEVGLDKVAKQFAEGKADILLEVLKAIKDVKPVLEKNDTRAVFKLPREIRGAPRDTLNMKKVDKFWYIEN
jgi:hypothetical protein